MSSIPHPSNRAALINSACIAVAILGVFGARNSYQASSDYSTRYPDLYGGARAELRFAPVLARFPANAEMGYFTDLDPSLAAAGSAYLAALYAVAPRLLLKVDPQTKPEWAVGNFSKPQDYAAAGEARGYSMAEDLGNGVVLFRRKSS